MASTLPVVGQMHARVANALAALLVLHSRKSAEKLNTLSTLQCAQEEQRQNIISAILRKSAILGIPRESLLVQVHDQRIVRRHSHIESHVELEIVYQQRIVNVLAHDHGFVQRNLFWLKKDAQETIQHLSVNFPSSFSKKKSVMFVRSISGLHG